MSKFMLTCGVMGFHVMVLAAGSYTPPPVIPVGVMPGGTASTITWLSSGFFVVVVRL